MLEEAKMHCCRAVTIKVCMSSDVALALAAEAGAACFCSGWKP